MEWFFSFFKPKRGLEGVSVICGLHDRNISNDWSRSVNTSSFDLLYDINTPLHEAIDESDLDLDQGELDEFIRLNQSSVLVLDKLEEFLTSVAKNQSIVITQVNTKEQADLIRKYGGFVIDISYPGPGSKLPETIKVGKYQLQTPNYQGVDPCYTFPYFYSLQFETFLKENKII